MEITPIVLPTIKHRSSLSIFFFFHNHFTYRIYYFYLFYFFLSQCRHLFECLQNIFHKRMKKNFDYTISIIS